MNRARFFDNFFPSPHFWVDSVLQELRETLTVANTLIAAIGIRFKSGEPAEDLIAQLSALLAILSQQTKDLPKDIPSDLQAELTQLFSCVDESVSIGENWLRETGPELASQQLRQRLRRTYGVT